MADWVSQSPTCLDNAHIFQGLNLIAESYCDILLDCYIDCTPVEEILRASCRKAYGVCV
jgi:hypothetical protein